MIKKHLFLSLVIALLSQVGHKAQADPIDVRKATDIARHYMKNPVIVAPPSTRTVRSSALEEDPAYHLFVSESEKRFVIVSGESKMNEIVGYGNLPSGNPGALPPQLQALLRQYSETVLQVRNGQQPATTTHNTLLRRRVLPLVTAQWGQSYPYNCKTPRIGGKATYTGCVATAPAQFLYFYKWPKQRPELYVSKAGD